MSVAVLIPFASGDAHRVANLEHVTRWYEGQGWPVHVAGDDGHPSGWSKATAVKNALALADPGADTLVIADADCLCDGVVEAVEQVQGRHVWASPHASINRLSLAATRLVLAGEAPHFGMELCFKQYRGVAGGGITVVRRDVYEQVPLDPRFVVTHGEDTSWSLALRCMVGRPWRGAWPLWHLWHPAVPPMGARYAQNKNLHQRYLHARKPAQMRALLAEITDYVPDVGLPREPPRGRCAVVVPVMRRPGNAAPFMASLGASGADAHAYAIADADDTETIEAWRAAGATVLLSDRGSRFGEKVNAGYQRTAEEWMLLVGDDVRFHPGWLQAALDAAGDRYDVVSTNDLARDDLDRLAVHPLIRRSYIDDQGASWDGPGLVAHEGYRHWYVDREWSQVAGDRHALVYAADAVIEHLHPIWGKAATDPVYAAGQAAAQDDHRIYRRRWSVSRRRHFQPHPEPEAASA
jgi:hypothetical protein